ncbi:hypothetical protein ABB37_09015 [Leptomonas pyrrhocoris]|uniref:Uncharacterized protein n=1 Tax=Leptomonas pyrrhocoris TaxID=157538 RepID=A0A0M9FS17_LEPPY|nr:hypothetical protein ABB37_09015 [Leptomonas pyrrhocoris]KPA74696.1 hypothetical protein ABB37_09015 [Leptomonas pyrrhocoris]|eukprot:XP_015653135.1 hypothetical protein ABB37_09015 [Leptomonas pyrrhocoris]
MGALPSRESHEGPNTVYFGNNTGVVTFRLPMTPHFFPSADCLAFKEVHRVRDSQSCKYSFNIREASAVLPEAAAKAFTLAQEEYWGPEAEVVDPSLHYHDEEVQARLAESGHSRGEKQSKSKGSVAASQHIRRSVECRRELYQMLVINPSTNALIDTDAEMLEIFLADQRWRAARDVVRRHHAYARQQRMTEVERSQLDSAEVVDVDVSAAELEVAEAVPPPRKWLRPLPEVVVERMSMEDACAAHRAYRERGGDFSTTSTQQQQQVPSSKTSTPLSASGNAVDRHDMRCNQRRGPADTDVIHRTGDAVALSVLDVQGRQPFVENTTLNEEMLKSYPSFQDDHLPFEMDEQYMDGRVHMVAYEGVNYLFAYNPAFVRAMGKTAVFDGSLVEERRRHSGAVQSERCRRRFTTTHTVATRQADDFDDPNQRRAYEIFQPVYTRYYIPVIPVRVLGVDGFIPCRAEDGDSSDAINDATTELRGAPWMRGVAGGNNSEVVANEEDQREEERQLLQKYGVPPPPVLRSCRFIHAVIGDKILNRMTVLGCMTFRERCIDAGLPDAIACPLWGVLAVSDIPQLQLQREIELRLLAAIHEIDDGDMRVRDALARQHRWNDYVNFTNSPMYGFIVSAPPERRFRTDADGKLKEVDEAEGNANEQEGTESRSRSGSVNEREKDEEQRPRQQRGGRRENSNHSSGGNTKSTMDDAGSPNSAKAQRTPHEIHVESSSNVSSNNNNGGGGGASGKEHPALALSVAGATSSPSSDTESRDEHSGSTSARSAAHNIAPIAIVDHVNGEGNGVNALPTKTATAGASSAVVGGVGGGAARLKRTRDGQTCVGGCANLETADNNDDDDLQCLAEPPVELACAWSFKRRRLGIAEEVVVNPNYSEEDWMPMVNPLTKDVALAMLGIRFSMRGRVALVRYSGGAVQKVLYYLSQASAPIFCLPYVGPPQQCANVYLENVLRLPPQREGLRAVPQNGLPPPTPAQIASAMAAYRQGKASCYVCVNLNDRAVNPPTSCVRNHRRDDALMAEATAAGITSRLILAQMPLKADARCALEWYRKSLPHGGPPSAAAVAGDEQQGNASSTLDAAWPSLLDAPAPCDGDVLVVCPRTHRWIRITTLMLLSALLLVHKKNREKTEELAVPVPVLELFNDEYFPTELEICYEALIHKNVDSEGMQCHLLHMRGSFSYNGIVELVLDRLRTVVDLEKYEDKDDAGWLVLREPPALAGEALATPTSSQTSSPTTATYPTSNTTSASSTSHVDYGLPNSGAAALTNRRYMESGSYFIWSFQLLGQRFFFGTKPRFIRLALQRQKQNQRRRQKRKERDAVAGSMNAPAESTTTNTTHTTAAATPATKNHKRGADRTGTATAPRSTTADFSSPANTSESAGNLSSLSDSASFSPKTTIAPIPKASPAHPKGAGVDACMPITAADRAQLAHNALHASAHPPEHRHAPPPPSSSSTHIPYAPLHLVADDRLNSDEGSEIRECRQRHRQWMEARGVFVASTCAGANLPLSAAAAAAAADTSKWAYPPLAGQQSCRRRLVVPIAPHCVGLPRYVSCDDLQKGVSGVAEAFNSAVPVQRSGSPRVVDAERTSFRWDPYRTGQ